MKRFPRSFAVGCLFLLGLLAIPAQGRETKTAARGVDAATVAAYESLGAVYGGWDKKTPLTQFLPGREQAEKGVPIFRFTRPLPPRLPEVAVPFGLDLTPIAVAESQLKNLAGLKNLVWLRLSHTTDAGLKSLAEIKSLTSLALTKSYVTDAGLKDLAGFTNLVSLTLNNERNRVIVNGIARPAPPIRVTPRYGVTPASRFMDSGRHFTDAGLKELAGLKKLTALDLSESYVTDEGLMYLANVKNLTTLDLEYTEIVGPGLKELEALDKLTALNLAHSKVTDWGLKGMAGFKNLTTLNLSDTRVMGEGLKHLVGCKKLTSLSLDEAQLTDSAFFMLREIGLLHTLDLAQGKDGARPKSADDIVALDLSHTQITAEGLRALAGLKNIAMLSFKDVNPSTHQAVERPITDATLHVLRDLGLLHALPLAKGKDGKRPHSAEQIVSLDLSDTDITEAGLKELAGLKNLASLKLAARRVGLTPGTNVPQPGPITDKGLKELASLTNLTALDLRSSAVSDAGLKELAPLKKLASLNLQYTAVSDAGLKDLAPLKNLSSLNLQHTAVSDVGLKELARFQRLYTLELSGRQISDAGLKSLAELKNLTSLFLTDTSVTNAGIAEMRNAVPTCQIFLQRP